MKEETKLVIDKSKAWIAHTFEWLPYSRPRKLFNSAFIQRQFHVEISVEDERVDNSGADGTNPTTATKTNDNPNWMDLSVVLHCVQ